MILFTKKRVNNKMLKKIFIKISRILGYEIIDQNKFFSPTLNREINKNLDLNNDKSIVLPLGNVKITRKVNSILLILRTNTKVNIWNQNKKRVFDKPKFEYTYRSINSLVKSINYLKSKNKNINVELVIVDDNSEKEKLTKINEILINTNINKKIINLDRNIFLDQIKNINNYDTFGNLASLLKCFNFAKENTKDLVFFLEDDYIHFETMLDEMISTYQRISSQTKKELILCPADYPYLYMENRKTNIMIGSKRHWQIVDKSLCTFLTSKEIVINYWDNFFETCKRQNHPFEKYLNEIYIKEYCLSPIKSLSIHLTNINSSYGISPFIDIKKIWEENKLL